MTPESKPFLHTGWKLWCKSCGDHILTLELNVYPGQRIDAWLFRRNDGQAPFQDGERMNCKKCGNSYHEDLMRGISNAPR